MAAKEDKYEDNVAGKFYVDTECIDCNLCRELAPENFTNPPKGIIANCHSVPFLSLKDNILGPNPILKTETSILLRRATMKCPNSCTNITMPKANTIDRN